MRIIGLTGSIGMGKSTTAGFFREAGVPVWDADAAVYALYAPGGAAVPAIAALRPQAVRGGAVDRADLRRWIAEDPGALARIEAAVHPLVAADRDAFLDRARAAGAALAVIDVPLLFEAKTPPPVDIRVVVTAPPEVQRARVLARPGMTEAHFEALLAKQMPDAEKRRRADHVIETLTLEGARQAVQDLLAELRR
jgi:dephospho-CoA kinase